MLPEIILLTASLAVLFFDFLFKKIPANFKAKTLYGLVQISLVLSLGVLIYFYNFPQTALRLWGIDPLFIVIDTLGYLLKIAITLAVLGVFCFSHDYLVFKKISLSAFYSLSLLALAGMFLLVSAHHFLILFLALELSALPVYALVALWHDAPYGSEAAIKYFVMGALATSMLLYGLSLFYGLTGSLEIKGTLLAPSQSLLMIFAAVFILAGIAFKLGAAPFHAWVPDVYTGAPLAVTLFISAMPKMAALGVMFRLLGETLPSIQPAWQTLLTIFSLLSIALGNLAAIRQSNIKKMLAYSSIAQMGYTFLGLIAGTVEGFGAALFYMLSYSLIVMGALSIVMLLSHQKHHDIEEIEALKGLNSRNPWLAFMLLLILFSMAGIPPMAGFFAKLGVLQALMDAHYLALPVLAVIFSVIGAYYYIYVIKIMYFEEPDHKKSLDCSFFLKTVISLSGIGTLLLGLFPHPLMMLCRFVFLK